jgi:hypothetical protein
LRRRNPAIIVVYRSLIGAFASSAPTRRPIAAPHQDACGEPFMRTGNLTIHRGSAVALLFGLLALAGCVAYEPYPATPAYGGYYYSPPAYYYAAPSYSYYRPCCTSYYSFSYTHRDGDRGHRDYDRRRRDWR